MSSLFDIEARLLAAKDMAESGEYDDEAITTTLECLDMELEDKADNYAALITVIDGETATIDKEIERLRAAKTTRTNFKERLKANLHGAMSALERPKIKTALHSFSIAKNPPSVHVFDETAIPPEYFVQPPPVLNKSAIRDALKDGEAVPGATLTQGESLRIR